MNKNRHFLIIRLSGKAVRAGRIPVYQLLRLLSELNKVFNRVGRVLLGEIGSVRKGPVQRSIKDETALDLIKITHGSPETILGL